MRARRHRALEPLLVPVALLLYVFRRLIFLGELPFRRDASQLFVPLKQWMSQALRAGELPEWWPWDGLGMPFVAVPVLSAFHPSNLLFVVLPFKAAFVLQVLVPMPVAVWGTWRLARALGLRPVFAALAVSTYTLGFYFLCLVEFTSMSLAAAALPWLWWGGLRCRRSTALRPAAVGLPLAWMLLAGDPHLAIMGLMGSAALMARRAPLRRHVRSMTSWVSGAALGATLAAVQLVPSLLLFRESPRATGAGVAGPDHWRFDLAQLSGMVFPDALLGRDVMFDSTYLGLGVMALAVTGAMARGPSRGALVGIAVVSMVLATGSATPLWSVFSAVVPFWKSFQFPVKAVGPAMLAVPLLAARGAQEVLRRDLRRFLPGGLCAVAVVIGGASSRWGTAGWALGLAGVFVLAAQRRPLAPALAWCALGLVALELGLVNQRVVPTTPDDAYEPPPLARVLEQHGVSGEGFSYLFTWKASRPFGPGLEQSLAQNAALIPLRGALHGLPTSNVYLQGFSARYQELVLAQRERWLGGLAGVFGTRFFIAAPSQLRPEQLQQVIARDERIDAVVVPFRRFLPRAYVTQGVTVRPRAEVPDYLGSPSFRAGAEVVLEAEAPGVSPDLERVPEGPARAVERIRREGDAVEIETTLSQPGVLVLNESFYEGVEAREDGTRLAMYPANHLVRAVPLGAGRHVIRFEYRTPGLALGAGLSASAIVLLVVAGVGQRALRLRTPLRRAPPG